MANHSSILESNTTERLTRARAHTHTHSRTFFECVYPTEDPVPDPPPQRWAFPVELHLCTLYLSCFRLITVYIPAFSTRVPTLTERPCFNDLCIPGAGPVPGLKGSTVNILFPNTLKLTNASFTWWRRKWQPTQYSCLENPTDEAW